jgi:DNA-directed RNA polymerase specialized sigma24 family protein
VLRVSGRQIPTSDEVLVDKTPVSADPLDAKMLISERDRAIADLMSRLPCRCRTILELLLADPPLSYQRLGEVLNMPIGSIGPTRARCLEHLRRLATTVGLSPAEDL